MNSTYNASRLPVVYRYPTSSGSPPLHPPPSSSPPPWGRGRVYFLKLMGRCGWSLNKCQNLLPPFPHPLKKGCGQEKNMLTKQVCKSTFFTKRDSDTLQGPSQFHFHMGVTASSTPSPPPSHPPPPSPWPFCGLHYGKELRQIHVIIFHHDYCRVSIRSCFCSFIEASGEYW